MAYSRRPARFERRNSMQMGRTISQEQLQSLRAVAAGVYKKEDPASASSEATKPATGKAKEEAGSSNIGMQAPVAGETGTRKEEPGVEKKEI